MSSRLIYRKKGFVRIDELSKIVNRLPGTIRKWERTEILPAHLMPHRTDQNWRVWTYDQVYGADGIIAWMKKEDLRPGRLVTPPDKADQHVAAMRTPKFLSGYHIRSARVFVEQGKSREWIVNKLYPRTRYARPQNLEAALVKVFAQNDWYLPPHIPHLLPLH